MGTALCQVACGRVTAVVWLFVCSLIQQTFTTSLLCARSGFDLGVGLHARWWELASVYGSRRNTSPPFCLNSRASRLDPHVQILTPALTSWVAWNLKLFFWSGNSPLPLPGGWQDLLSCLACGRDSVSRRSLLQDLGQTLASQPRWGGAPVRWP